MPRYEFSEGTSNKFWEINLKGASFTTTYGKIGTAGQTTLKELKSEADAKKEYDKLIAEKTKKGYVLAGGGAPAAAPAKPKAADDEPKPKASAKAPAKVAVPVAAAVPAGGPSEAGARYFELVEGSSSKFWEIKLDGEALWTRYGKIGTAGQKTEKDFESSREARAEYQKLVDEKTKKGYVEHGAAPPPPRNPELEAAILANPYDKSAYMVYADWLQGQGDLRGELISLQLAAEDKKDAKLARAAAALIDSNPDYFLGPLAEDTKVHDDSDDEAFTWRFGYIHKAKISHDENMDSEFDGKMADVLKALFQHPSGQFIAELAFGFNGDPSDGDLDDYVKVIEKHAPPTLRVLHFGEFEYPDQTEMSWYHVGKLGPVWKAVPKLEKLIVQGGDWELGTINLPAVKHAEFRTGGLTSSSAKAIAKASWPNIEHLEVWYGDDNYGGNSTIADVRALLGRTDLPKLTSLGLRNAEMTDDMVPALIGSPLLKQITRLDLSLGCLTDAGAQAIAANKAAFAHLDELDVSESYLTKTGIAALKGVAKVVISKNQRDYDPEYRHPSVGE